MNLVLFQLSWWGFFLAAYYQSTGAVLPDLVLYSLAHFIFVSKDRLRDLKLMLVFSVLGYLIDLFLLEGRLFSMEHKNFPESLWLFGMWWAFTSCLSYSMKKLIVRPLWGLPLAALFGPLSYLAGEKIGVLTYFKPLVLFYGIHGLLWAGFFFLLFRLEKRKFL